MKPLLTALSILVLGGSLALAQCPTPSATTTGMSSVSTVMTSDDIAAANSPYAVSSLCPCAAIAANTVGGDRVIMVLGSEEYFALDNLHLRNLNWREVSANYPSMIDPGNPLTSFSPNGVVRHHGNPYYPYYQVGWYHPASTTIAMTNYTVAGTTEFYAATLPSNLATSDQNTLNAITNQYGGLTPQQAMILGYQPLGTCIAGLGQVYLNPGLVGNSIDPMKPQAFVFSADGHLLAAQYEITCVQNVALFGQPFIASDEVAGGQQLTVWLWQSNSNGFFAPRNAAVGCGPNTAAVNNVCVPTVAGTSEHYRNRRCMDSRL